MKTKLTTIFLLLFFFTGYSQTIEFVKSIKDTVKYGIEVEPKGAYNIGKQIIKLQENWVDARSVHVLLHELGHHLWYYGGIDTTMILLDLTGEYFNRSDVLELFAEEHWKYFFNDAAPKFKEIFDDFYNRPGTRAYSDSTVYIPIEINWKWDELKGEWIKE